MSHSTTAGGFALILQAHLPFVRHPEHDRSIEEEWFFEALAECYLPLWRVLRTLAADGIPAPITLAWSGTLVAMLQDDWLLRRFDLWLHERLDLLHHEARRAAAPQHLVAYHDARLRQAQHDFAACDRHLLRAFAELARTGELELATGSATHAFAPLWQDQPELWQAQVRLPLAPFRAATGGNTSGPRGMWWAECGYVPGMECELAAAGIQWFVLDAHGLAFADPPPATAGLAPVWCGHSQVAAFARDPLTAAQIWHADAGFPADPVYLDFHRDIGHLLPLDELHGVIGREDLRRPTGIRYWRITDRHGTQRDLYDPQAAAARIRQHAREFVHHRRQHLNRVRATWTAASPPLIVAPYDAELFGHWWHEGPAFIDALYREFREPAAQNDVQPTTPGAYLARWPEHAMATPAASSWGSGGFSNVWLNEQTDWIVREGHRVTRALIRLHGSVDRRVVAQAWRELLLAQASDWPFLIRMGTARSYATSRARDHLDAAARLVSQAERVDAAWLAERIAQWGTLFPQLETNAGPQSI